MYVLHRTIDGQLIVQATQVRTDDYSIIGTSTLSYLV
jgi:hypothetical protein